MAHKLPDLPYSYDALEPYYDEQTVRIHHDLHHKGYVDGLNKAEEALDRAREQDDYALVKHWEKNWLFMAPDIYCIPFLGQYGSSWAGGSRWRA